MGTSRDNGLFLGSSASRDVDKTADASPEVKEPKNKPGKKTKTPEGANSFCLFPRLLFAGNQKPGNQNTSPIYF